FDRFPDIAVALPGITKSDALVPSDVGEEKRYVRRLGRWDLTGVAKEPLRHLLHDLGHLARLSSHGRVVSSLSSASAGDHGLRQLIRQERRQGRCPLNLTCPDAASLLSAVLASSTRSY